MKVIKGLVLFGFLTLALGACFDAPEFDIVPEITFNRIQFKVTPSVGDADTLILYIDFKDGDGDLGLNDDFLEEPFNDSFYYLATGTNDTTRLTTEIVYTSSAPFNSYVLLKRANPDVKGPLVTNRTRTDNPNYAYLPVYDPNSCENYSFAEVLVPESFEAVDASYNITDTLQNQFGDLFFVVEEPLLFKKNIYHNNIEVKFWVFENGNWEEFDWYERFCIDFNGRFPYLGNQKRPLEGTIRYAMPNSSFFQLFSIKQLKLSVKIRDRALHESREIETPPFTLSSIQK